MEKKQIAAQIDIASSLWKQGEHWEDAAGRARYNSPKQARRVGKAEEAFGAAKETLLNLWREVAPEEDGKYVAVMLRPDCGIFPSNDLAPWKRGSFTRGVGYVPCADCQGDFSEPKPLLMDKEEAGAEVEKLREKFCLSSGTREQHGWYDFYSYPCGPDWENGKFFSPKLWEINQEVAVEKYRKLEEENWVPNE